jgi:hypothetical protein
MCVHLFHQGSTLRIEYASESITLSNGGSEDLLDLLVTNRSGNDLDRIHAVYPHAVPPDSKLPWFEDLTETWLESSSPYNLSYADLGAITTHEHSPGVVMVRVSLPDANNALKEKEYAATIRGSQSLVPYEVADQQMLDDIEWRLLSELGWSIFSIKFTRPLGAGESRWLRLRASTGGQPQNRYRSIDRWVTRMLGLLTHHFEIAGPLDIKHRLAITMKAASSLQAGPSAIEQSVHAKVMTLTDKVLTRGLLAPGTETVVNDWRINVFSGTYRQFDDPVAVGDIQQSGELFNLLVNPHSREHCYQWKAGEVNVPQGRSGMFSIRMRANDVPLVTYLAPWIGIAIGLVALVAALLTIATAPWFAIR